MEHGLFHSLLIHLFYWWKHSAIYSILTRFYNTVSNGWQNSFITSAFRKDRKEILQNSQYYKISYSIFSFFDFLRKKIGIPLNKMLIDSKFIDFMQTLLQNVLAFNTRFIGILGATAALVFAVATFVINNEFSIVSAVIFTIFAIMCLLNANLTGFLRASFFVKLFENMFGLELTFNFFNTVKTQKKLRFISAVFWGIAAGLISIANPLYGALAVAGIVFVSLVLSKPVTGVFAVVFLAPLLPTMAVAALCILCLISVIAKSLIIQSFKWKFDSVSMLIISLLGVFIVSAITSFTPQKSLQIWGLYLAFMSFYFTALNTIKTKKQLFSLLSVFVISGSLVAAYGIMQYVFGWDTRQAWMDEEMFDGIKMRIYSTLENPNVLGEYLLLVLPIAIGLAWTRLKSLTKTVYGGIAVVLLVALILTYSRGCWVGLLFGAAIYVTFVNGKMWGLLLMAIPFAPFLIPQSIIERFTSIGDMSDSSSSYRMFIWIGSLAMLKDFWISGIGMGEGAFNSVYPFYSYNAIVAPHSHNLYLQMMVESGIVGLIVFLLILIMFFKKMISTYQIGGRKSDLSIMSVSISSALIAFLVQGAFDHCFYNYRVFLIFWIMLAFGMLCNYIAKAEKEKAEKAA